MPPVSIRRTHRCRRFPGDCRATSAVEFALIAPVLFLILFGTLTFGVHYSTRIALTYAASEGGRAAQAGLSDAERTTLAKTAVANTLASLSPLVDPTKASVNVTTGTASIGEVVTISIGYTDTRFAHMPFMPDLSQLAPVKVNYYVTDPNS